MRRFFLFAIAALLGSVLSAQAQQQTSNQAIQIRITPPIRPVCVTNDVEGTIDANFAPPWTLWIVVNPIQTPGDFWVQEKATLQSDGPWRARAIFGRPRIDVGRQFRFRAFVDPSLRLEEGQRLSNWPQARWSSNELRVTRRDCDVNEN